MFRFGIDRLLEDPSPIAGKRVGLLSHPAGLTSSLVPGWKDLGRIPGVRLVRLFGPEHGIDGGAQDMASVSDSVHPETGLPVRSLYGRTRQSLSPSLRDLEELDVLVCDLQDVGSRYYTFVWTVCLAMEACAAAGVRVVVCDRPNPLGGAREGEPQRDDLCSFVGLSPLPVRHGRTVGEIASHFRKKMRLDVDLVVIPMKGWARQSGWPRSALWMAPSPNMPTLETALVYPGACLLEATNLSEGRGTTRPFELVGAPFLDAEALSEALDESALPGVRFLPVHFIPTFQKFAGEICHGVFQRVLDAEAYRPFETGLRMLEACRRNAPRDFRWRENPYEFETRPAIDLLTGSPEFRDLLDRGSALDEYCRRQRQIEDPSPATLIYPDARPAVVGITGEHNSGKTTLLEKLVPRLRDRGLSVGAVKHTPHDVEDDVAGKDSYRARHAGAEPSAFVRTGESTVRRREDDSLERILSRDFSDCDVVLVEGYKRLPMTRIEVGKTRRFGVDFAGRDYTDDLDSLAAALLRHFRLE
ncbi:MAG: molybdopterin-guanine dinucleotide biosynthesis protein B [Thermoanaerobaculia bacterium]